jgi:hypothetical protein
MSVLINNSEELLHLVRKLGIKINTVGELEQLLKTVNATYNPEADRLRLARQVGLSVPIVSCIFAALATGGIVVPGLAGAAGNHQEAAVAVVWGVTCAVSLGALLFSLLVVLFHRNKKTAAPGASAFYDGRPLEESLAAFTEHPVGKR